MAMQKKFRIDENLYTAMHKCTRCGQCAYGTEEAEYKMLCPMQMKGKFFTYSAGGLMQCSHAAPLRRHVKKENSLRRSMKQIFRCLVKQESKGF